MAAETQTERQRGWLGQLSQPATGHQPVVGLQASDPPRRRMQHQTQRILGDQQGQTALPESRSQGSGLKQTMQQPITPAVGSPVRQSGFAGRQQQRTGTGRLNPAQSAIDAVRIHTLALAPEHGRLRQTRR